MDKLILTIPTYSHRNQIEQYRANIMQSALIHGVGGLHEMSVAEWLDTSAGFRDMRESGFVPRTQYIAIRKSDNKIVGSVNLRHELNDNLLRNGGHIGYMVATDERQKGYAKEMLRLGLLECKKLGIERVLVTCKKSNIGSAKTIIANGGVLENEITLDENVGGFEHKGEIMQRYWITLCNKKRDEFSSLSTMSGSGDRI